MLEVERQQLIQQLVQGRSIVSVADLVKLLGASKATVRRDINAMAHRGLLRRIRGGAQAVAPARQPHLAGVPFRVNREIEAPRKRAIARAAAALLKDGESIIINGGTTTFYLAELLGSRSLDVLTNSIAIVTRLLASGQSRVTVPSGTIYREQNIILSPYENDAINNFWGQKLLTGCYGLNRLGMMESDPLIVQAGVRLLKRADELVVLADSRKLRQRSSMIVAPLERISTLITDSGATDEELEQFQSAGIRVIRVKPDARDSESQITPHAAPA